MDLRHQLQACLRDRVCLVGVGHPDYGDDAFGVRLAEKLAETATQGRVILLAATAPEEHLLQLAEGGFDHVIFLDAVEFGGEPGSVVWLTSAEMAARFPQISTHRISLGLLARMIEAGGHTKAWLLGVQPETLKMRHSLSMKVEAALQTLAELLSEIPHHASAPPPQRGRGRPHSKTLRVRPRRVQDESEALGVRQTSGAFTGTTRAEDSAAVSERSAWHPLKEVPC